ncbi:MAG: UDP-N-acetylmuramate dehydrogenase [Treponema sp.]|jgi:UDP-N-acetylmuramate dehydrogenase|nr:UDP-N-acetylmuramate dehydrogenase [Treponema sp.]
MDTIEEFLKNSNIPAHAFTAAVTGKPLSKHTTFHVGGPAALWVRPDQRDGNAEAIFSAFQYAAVAGARVCVLGRGANIVFSDAGFPGIVLDTSGWNGVETFDMESGRIVFRAGTPIDGTVETLARNSFGVPDREAARDVMGTLLNFGYGGLEFLAGMPGTIGGALYMNARCYGRSIAERLISVTIIDEHLKRISVPFRAADWGYKKSPFQNRDILIVDAEFSLDRKEKNALHVDMETHRADREKKGHYRFPSAGSVFKNNHTFGSPTGKIIDELGLCGHSHGGAMVAPFHGNIIVNTGGATAADIRFLVDDIAEMVRKSTGLELETEIVFK